MSIKIGSKIEKLNPDDQYKLMDGGDVEGFELTFKSIRIVGGKLVGTRSDDSQVDIGAIDNFGSLKANQVPMIGPDGNVVYSGITVTDEGLVKIPENTLGFGEPMELGSATGFAIIHNNVTELSYMLLDYSVSDTAPAGRPTQFYIDTPALSSTKPYGTDITDNPAMFSQTTSATGASFKLILDANEEMKNVKIQIIDGKTKIPFKHLPTRIAWEDDTKPGMDFRAGKNTLDFFSREPDDPDNGVFNIGVGPITLTDNWDIDYIIKADNVNLKGDTDGNPWIQSLFGVARFRGMAYQDELRPPQAANGVVSIGMTSDGKLLVTHADGAKHLIPLPATPNTELANRVTSVEQTMHQQSVDIATIKQNYGRVDLRINALEGVYTYDGDSVPDWPDDPKAAYFINLHDTAARDIDIDMPNPVGGNVGGAMVHSVNSNSQAVINFAPAMGFTVNGGVKYTQAANTFTLFVLDGTDWKVVQSNPLTSQQMTVTAQQVTTAIDRGTAPNSGSVKSLGDGWWIVPAANDQLTGRPSGATGDLTMFRQTVMQSGKTNFVTTMVFGSDVNNKPSMWVQYRTNGRWTSWFKVNESTDLTAITSDVASLKAGDAGQLARLTRLETDMGKIYSPDKVSFDASVNALIDAKIKSTQGDRPALPVGVPKIYAEYNTAFPTAIGTAGQSSSTSGIITITRSGSDVKRIFLLVPNDMNQAEDVTGFSVDGGLKALWDARDVTIEGKEYRAFYTSGGFTETTNRIRVYFGNQG